MYILGFSRGREIGLRGDTDYAGIGFVTRSGGPTRSSRHQSCACSWESNAGSRLRCLGCSTDKRFTSSCICCRHSSATISALMPGLGVIKCTGSLTCNEGDHQHAIRGNQHAWLWRVVDCTGSLTSAQGCMQSQAISMARSRGSRKGSRPQRRPLASTRGSR